jgi:predicted ATPase/transcriptional regulator with XRE-family HTH domain
LLARGSIKGRGPFVVSLSDTKPIQNGEIIVGEDSFGEWLSKRRKSLGLTQKQLASQIHCATITLRKIEAEQRKPSLQIAERLAQILFIPGNEQNRFLDFARGNWQSGSTSEWRIFPSHLDNSQSAFKIPTPLTALIGREQELSTIIEYFIDADIRLVTISGSPGIGKTRLSQDVARGLLAYFPDGIFFIPLHNLENSQQLTLTILQALGYIQQTGKSPLDMLISRIADQHILLVLDNVEHLIDVAGPFTFELLHSCSHLKIMITSREILRISGERVFQLSGLNIPSESQLTSLDVEKIFNFPALRLFEERANAVKTDFYLSSNNIEDVCTICKHLDGLPLAIELLAVWIKIMTPHALLEQLNNHFVLHTEGSHALPLHQRTLYNAINWSYNLLSDQEKYLFNNLSVFTGGFTLQAAEAVLSEYSANGDATDIIANLAEKSLLQRGLDNNDEPRFYMLTTLRQFASEQLAKLDGVDSAQEFHRTYYLKFSSVAMSDIHGQNRVEWINRLELEQDNLRAALNWSILKQNTQSALLLLTMLGWLWYAQGNYREMECWLDQVKFLPDIDNYPQENSELLLLTGQLKSISGEVEYTH